MPTIPVLNMPGPWNRLTSFHSPEEHVGWLPDASLTPQQVKLILKTS